MDKYKKRNWKHSPFVFITFYINPLRLKMFVGLFHTSWYENELLNLLGHNDYVRFGVGMNRVKEGREGCRKKTLYLSKVGRKYYNGIWMNCIKLIFSWHERNFQLAGFVICCWMIRQKIILMIILINLHFRFQPA